MTFQENGAQERKPPHDLLYVDGFARGRVALDTIEVNDAARAYDLLRSYALSPEDSATRVGEHLEGLKKQ